MPRTYSNAEYADMEIGVYTLSRIAHLCESNILLFFIDDL